MQGGASSSIVFTTFDERLVIKTITKSEKKILLKMLYKYSGRVIGTPQSKLVRILGIFRLIPENQDFIIMENIIPNRESAVIFDLKGSSIDRLVRVTDGNLPYGKVLKDENFRLSGLKIKISEEMIEEIIKVLKEDFMLMKTEYIMDYSILLGFYQRSVKITNRYQFEYQGEIFTLGIIDILQKYNFSKSTEGKLKSIYKKDKALISTADPEAYFVRIYQFLHNLFEKS